MDHKIIEEPEMEVKGIKIEKIEMNEKNEYPEIVNVWTKFMNKLGQPEKPTFGVSINWIPETMTYDYIACSEQEPLDSSDMIDFIIPASKYASFTFKGHMKNFGTFINEVFQKGIPEAGLTMQKGEVGMIEMYDERYKHNSEDSEMELWIPIK